MNLSTYPLAALVSAYNGLTGATIKKFENRQIAERRLAAAAKEKGASLKAVLTGEAEAPAPVPAKKTNMAALAAVADAPKAKPSKEKKGGRAKEATSKTQIVEDLLLREEGTTREEILKATGWPSVSVQQMAKARKLTLTVQKDGRSARYWAKAA